MSYVLASVVERLIKFLRQRFEAEVSGLRERAEALLKTTSGLEERIARGAMKALEGLGVEEGLEEKIAREAAKALEGLGAEGGLEDKLTNGLALLVARFHARISELEDLVSQSMTAVAKRFESVGVERASLSALRRTALHVLRLQSSLEDSLSAMSLLLELLTSLSILMVLVVAWTR